MKTGEKTEKLKDIIATNKDLSFIDLSEIRISTLIIIIIKKIIFRFIKIFNTTKAERFNNQLQMFQGYDKCIPPLYKLSGREMIGRLSNLVLEKTGLLNYCKKQKELLALEDEIKTELLRTVNKVMIYAPFYSKGNEKDGYMQRIKRIDEALFNDYFRIYVLEDGTVEFNILKINSNIFFIHYNSNDANHRRKIFELAHLCGLQYVHSINRFMPGNVNAEMSQLIISEDITTIWDVHGAVPEECALNGDNYKYENGNKIERIFMQFSDVIIVVNNAMRKHLIEKHGCTKAEFVVLPIYNSSKLDNYLNIKEKKKKSRIPSIIYCGGLQKWQNIELMQSIIEKTNMNYHYIIIVPSPLEFNSIWKDGLPENISVESKQPEEIGEVYQHCDYGFILRDDIVVNRVACPTKLFEYLKFGIIPVFKSPYIGDFLDMGIHYIDYNDLLTDNLLSTERRDEFAIENYQILEKMEQVYLSGLARLHTYLNGAI